MIRTMFDPSLSLESSTSGKKSDLLDQSKQSPDRNIDSSPLQTSMDKNKQSLKVKLLLRRPHSQLVEQGIIPSLKMSPAIHEQCKQLERAKTSDMLKAKIQQRPNRVDLERRHILEEDECHIDPSLVEKQRMLKKARLADHLNSQIQQRPGPLELIKKNILHTEQRIEKIVKEGLVPFKATSEGLQSGPNLPISYISFEDESLSSENETPQKLLCNNIQTTENVRVQSSIKEIDLPERLNCTQIISNSSLKNVEFACKSTSTPFKLEDVEKKINALEENTPTDTSIPSQNFLCESQNFYQTHNLNSSSNQTLRLDVFNKDKTRKKLKSKPITKSRTIKFHEYKGPPSALQKINAGNISSEETSYQIMLKQQNCLLKFLETLNKDQLIAPVSINSAIAVSNSTVTVGQCETSSAFTAPFCVQPINTSISVPVPCRSATNRTPVIDTSFSSPNSPWPTPVLSPSLSPTPTLSKSEKNGSTEVTTLEKMKVSDLKLQLKRRNLPVSGAKPQLIERLRPYLPLDATESLNSSNVEISESQILKSPHSTDFPGLDQQQIDVLKKVDSLKSVNLQPNSKTATIIFSNDELLREQQRKINELQQQLKQSQEELLQIRQKQKQQQVQPLQQLRKHQSLLENSPGLYQMRVIDPKPCILENEQLLLPSLKETVMENCSSNQKFVEAPLLKETPSLINSQISLNKLVVKQQLEAKIQKKKETGASLEQNQQKNILSQQEKSTNSPQTVLSSKASIVQINDDRIIYPKKNVDGNEFSINNNLRKNIGVLWNESNQSLVFVGFNEQKNIRSNDTFDISRILKESHPTSKPIISAQDIVLPIQVIKKEESVNYTILHRDNYHNLQKQNVTQNDSNVNIPSELSIPCASESRNDKDLNSVSSTIWSSSVSQNRDSYMLNSNLSNVKNNKKNALLKESQVNVEPQKYFDDSCSTRIDLNEEALITFGKFIDTNAKEINHNVDLHETPVQLSPDTSENEKMSVESESFQSYKNSFCETNQATCILTPNSAKCRNTISFFKTNCDFDKITESKAQNFELENHHSNSSSVVDSSAQNHVTRIKPQECTSKSSPSLKQNHFDEYELLELMSQQLEMDISENTNDCCSALENKSAVNFQNSLKRKDLYFETIRPVNEFLLHQQLQPKGNANLTNTKKNSIVFNKSDRSIQKDEISREESGSNVTIASAEKNAFNNNNFDAADGGFGDIPMDVCDDFVDVLENCCFSDLSHEANINLNFGDCPMLSSIELTETNNSPIFTHEQMSGQSTNIANKYINVTGSSDIFDLFNVDDFRTPWNDSSFPV